MKKLIFVILGFALSIQTKAGVPDFNWLPKANQPSLNWIEEVGAKNLPNEEIYEVRANGDGKTLCTKQVQETIDLCSRNGGGQVVFAPGTYLIGAIYLKEGVDLHINKDVTLLSSTDFKDFPRSRSRIAGIEMNWPDGLINIINMENVSISGEGTIDCLGKFCWDKYWSMREAYEKKKLRWIVDYDCERIRGIVVNNSKHVTLKNFKIQRTGFWAVQIVYSKNCTVDGLYIDNNIGGHGPSTDGIDIDSSEKILIQNATIDCNDDNICIKAGRDWDGLRVNKPSEYIVVRNCTALRGGGLLTCGSETSGGIRNVVAYDLKCKGTAAAIRFKSAINRGGFIKDIYISGIHAENVGSIIVANLNWNPSYSYSVLPSGYNENEIPEHWRTMLKQVEPAERGFPSVNNIVIENIFSEGATQSYISVSGINENFPLRNLWLNNLKGTSRKAGTFKNTENVFISDFEVEVSDENNVILSNNKNMVGKILCKKK